MKKIFGIIAIIILILALVFSLYVRDNTPDRKAIKNIENSGLGSGELFVKEGHDDENGNYILTFGDDAYDYYVKADTGSIQAIHINDFSRQHLDKALVESGGERIPEEEANAIFTDLLNRFFPGADRENVNLSRTGNHLEEFVYSTAAPLAEGKSGNVVIALAFNGELSSIKTGESAEAPEAENLPAEPEKTIQEPAETEVIPVEAAEIQEKTGG